MNDTAREREEEERRGVIERERRKKECEISFRNRVPEKVDLLYIP